MGAPARIAIVSGYFNPIHIGHLRMLKAARELAPHLVVIVNNDKQQLLKKGRILMTEDDRHEIVAELRCVDEALVAVDDDATVVASLRKVRELLPGRRAALLQRRRPVRRRRSRPERRDPPDRGDRAADGLRRGRRGQGRLEQPDQRRAEPSGHPGEFVTFGELLGRELRRDPGRPLLTWYDDGTGERVELSVATYANWVAKAASLLVEEHDLERGDVLLVDLPSHWLGPVFLGAAWTAGLAVAFPSSDVAPNVVVCGPASLAAWAPRADDLPVLACALLPMGVRFAEPLPPGVHDVGVEVWGQPDAFTPYDPPGGSDVALVDGPVTQDELLGSPVAAGSSLQASTGGDRLLSTANPASPPGVAAVSRPLVSGGSLVLVAGADPARLDAIAEAELVTHRLG